ncbi:hypothetical protein ACI2KR_30130 [Pseudomonas luteola]
MYTENAAIRLETCLSTRMPPPHRVVCSDFDIDQFNRFEKIIRADGFECNICLLGNSYWKAIITKTEANGSLHWEDKALSRNIESLVRALRKIVVSDSDPLLNAIKDLEGQKTYENAIQPV